MADTKVTTPAMVPPSGRYGPAQTISISTATEPARTAKSVIFDIADNYGDTTFVGIRSIAFFLGGVLVSYYGAFTAYATTTYLTYVPAHTFDNNSKTGTWNGTQWLSGFNQPSNNRLIIVFDTPISFDEIIINNSHLSGHDTNTGAKNVKINLSSDTITSTVYDSAISNSTLLFDGMLDEHILFDTADDQSLGLIDPSSIYYTTDGSTPDATDNLYSTPITIFSGTLKAIGILAGLTDSDIASEAYTILDNQPIITILT